MTDLNIWSFLIGMLVLPVGWFLLGFTASLARQAMKEWARVITTVVHQRSGKNERNTVAGIINSAHWATFFGRNQFGVILFRGFDQGAADDATEALDLHGPHRTTAYMHEAVPRVRTQTMGLSREDMS